MKKSDVKELMEHINISAQMQEDIIMNVQERMERKNSKRERRKKTAAAAAVLIVSAGIVGIPAHALVRDLVKERMDRKPEAEVEELAETIQAQRTEADGFTREYTDGEAKRNKELWQAYENGTFPAQEILQVDSVDDAPADTLCYANDTGYFCLPDHEMTDEELLEIIDFQHAMSYAIEQSPAAQAAREEMAAEQAQLQDRVAEDGGIDAEEALRIAEEQMRASIGDAAADGKTDVSVTLVDLSAVKEYTDYELKGDLVYNVIFQNPEDHTMYFCTLDAADGRVVNQDGAE